VRLLLYLLDLVAWKAPPISPSPEKMGLSLLGSEFKIVSDLHSTVIGEDTRQPANDGRDHSTQSTFTLPLNSLGSLSELRSFNPRLKRDFCAQHVGKDSRACQNSRMIVDHVLPPLILLSRITQHGKEGFPSTVLDHDLNLNNPRRRFSYTRPTAAKANSLHCPSKNGTSRPLRPPCLFLGSRFEHHLITLFERAHNPLYDTADPIATSRRVRKSSQTGEKPATRRPSSCCVCSDTPGMKAVSASLTYSHHSLLVTIRPYR
jgi:hypothetical protein